MAFAIINLGIQLLIIVLGVTLHLRRHRQDRSVRGAFEAMIPWVFFAHWRLQLRTAEAGGRQSGEEKGSRPGRLAA